MICACCGSEADVDAISCSNCGEASWASTESTSSEAQTTAKKSGKKQPQATKSGAKSASTESTSSEAQTTAEPKGAADNEGN